jgi:hypothetical protein
MDPPKLIDTGGWISGYQYVDGLDRPPFIGEHEQREEGRREEDGGQEHQQPYGA